MKYKKIRQRLIILGMARTEMFNQGYLYDAVSISLKFKVYLFAFKGFFIILDEPFQVHLRTSVLVASFYIIQFNFKDKI